MASREHRILIVNETSMSVRGRRRRKAARHRPFCACGWNRDWPTSESFGSRRDAEKAGKAHLKAVDHAE